MTNYTDLDVTSLTFAYESQALTDDGDITIKNGVCSLDKTSPIAANLPAPDLDDNFKRLTIVSLSTQAHTVTAENGFGGTLDACLDETVATFSGVKGDTLDLMAYDGVWYVAGKHQVTITA